MLPYMVHSMAIFKCIRLVPSVSQSSRFNNNRQKYSLIFIVVFKDKYCARCTHLTVMKNKALWHLLQYHTGR